MAPSVGSERPIRVLISVVLPPPEAPVIAAIGALLLLGRVPLRGGMRVAVGCFVLLGAPVIASGILAGIDDDVRVVEVAQSKAVEPAREGLSESKQDPYAGASLRQD